MCLSLPFVYYKTKVQKEYVESNQEKANKVALAISQFYDGDVME